MRDKHSKASKNYFTYNIYMALQISHFCVTGSCCITDFGEYLLSTVISSVSWLTKAFQVPPATCTSCSKAENNKINVSFL